MRYLCPFPSMQTAAEKWLRSADPWCWAFGCLLNCRQRITTRCVLVQLDKSKPERAGGFTILQVYITAYFHFVLKHKPVSSMFIISSPCKGCPFLSSAIATASARTVKYLLTQSKFRPPTRVLCRFCFHNPNGKVRISSVHFKYSSNMLVTLPLQPLCTLLDAFSESGVASHWKH